MLFAVSALSCGTERLGPFFHDVLPNFSFLLEFTCDFAQIALPCCACYFKKFVVVNLFLSLKALAAKLLNRIFPPS